MIMHARDPRLSHRLVSFFKSRLSELNLEDFKDPRQNQGKRWQIETLLCAVLLGLASGKNSLAEVEHMTRELSQLSRVIFGIPKRISDTTLRDFLMMLDGASLRELLRQTVQLAIRRKALTPDNFPCGVVIMDGKVCTSGMPDEKIAQHHKNGEEHVRTVTMTLASDKTNLCLDAYPIPPDTNEMGIFKAAFDELMKHHGSLFKIVSYDAGATGLENADHVNQNGKWYLMGLKENQPKLFELATGLLASLGPENSLAETREYVKGGLEIRRIWTTYEASGVLGWKHMTGLVRVQRIVVDPKTEMPCIVDDRYFVTNIPKQELTSAQLLRLVRMHWRIENDCHNTLDRLLVEDKRPWIEAPAGMLAVLLLRRVIYNLLALFRGVTQRSDKKRKMPWKDLMRDIFLTLLRFSKEQLQRGSRLARSLNTG